MSGGIPDERCGFQWPPSDLERRAYPDLCNHACRRPPWHEGDHLCCQGDARHPQEPS